MAGVVTISRKLSISNDNVFDWRPQEMERNGRTFILCPVYDAGLFKFCTGKSIHRQWQDKKGCITEFMSRLITKRSNASQAQWELFNTNLQGQNDDDEPPNKRRKQRKTKIRQAKSQDAYVCGQIVTFEMPHLDQTKTISCLFGVKREAPWIEADPATLAYIAKGVSDDFNAGRFSQTRRWNKYRVGDDDNQAAEDGVQAGGAEDDDDDDVNDEDDKEAGDAEDDGVNDNE